MDESSLFMSSVRFLGELLSCIGLCRFILSLPSSPYDKAEEAKVRCHYCEEEVILLSEFACLLFELCFAFILTFFNEDQVNFISFLPVFN